MELQQKHSVTLNVYDIQEQAKTEDIYQTLQTPPTAVSRKVSRKKITVPLLIINILLLTTILMVTAIHYYHFRQSGEEDQKTNQEMWYLHDDTFYLFWSNHGDCKTAYSFCAERNANLATVTNDNRDWLQSQINGKRLLVKKYLEPNCTFFGETSYLSEQVAGWVCERPPACFRGC
ncbi:uncharacterized protein LOC108259990 isoform X3 [Ictalurus punctatus]|uniref:Uncharacterized protein LOC108259990 isoform X3 n=1 Tax=Ictalurus punctatus TaxID=7998 RepID=A0A2D0QAP5_ICTPU|nr:uncharacterized protein LOC108259990 isoform X3 [Ictalurus punctatus]